MKPAVKQHLATIRMLFDRLVIGHVVAVNPATSVRGPKYVARRGKTTVITADQSQAAGQHRHVNGGQATRSRTDVGNALRLRTSRHCRRMRVKDHYP